MKKHQFTSANNIDVTITVEGSYRDSYDKDLYVIASNGYEESFEECGDAEDIIEALEANGIEFDANPRHFIEHVIMDCMIVGDATLEQVLNAQVRWEEQRA